MTPRLSIIAASVRKIFAPTTPDSGDTYWDDVVLAMHMDGPDNGTVFIDVKGHTVTPNGGVVISGSKKKFGTASAYFDGVDDYLSIPSSSDFAFGAGDFTVELWVRPTALSSSQHIIGQWGSSAETRSWHVGIGDAGSIFLEISTSGVYEVEHSFETQTGFVAVDAWTHICVARSGNLLNIHVNGLLIYSQYVSITLFDVAASLRVGLNSSDTQPFNGYIDDLRITKGIARYTADFTPPTAAAPDFGLYDLFDPYIANVSLLMHMDGVDNGSVFEDVKGHTITPVGNAVTKTATKKFGSASWYFDGVDDYYLTIPFSSAFVFGAEDFTIECWINLATIVGNQTVIQIFKYGTNSWDMLFSGDTPLFRWSTNGGAQSGSVAGAGILAGTWTHIAAVRSGGFVTIFTNGAAGTPVAISGSLYAPAIGPDIGRNQDGLWYLNGYIDDLRITKGIARYIADFTPPIAAFPNVGP